MQNVNDDTTVESGGYNIHIENFEGPLDLLWDLIKKAKIEITDVSLSDITEQYIQYLKLMETMNIRVAVDFIRMASELLYYKSKALLPIGQMDDEYFVPPLPPELVEKLLEYKKFQQASRSLRELFESSSCRFTREPTIPEAEDTELYLEATLFDLLRAFAEMMEQQKTVEQEEIVFDEILVSDRIEFIKSLLKDRELITFAEIFEKRPSRMMIVATFLAILELAKMRMIKVVQHQTFGTIRIAGNGQA